MFKYHFTGFHRLFRWRPGYRYIQHRPPTVVDEKGRDLRAIKWISDRQMKQAGIYLYHYSYVLPKQAHQKVGYYTNVPWTSVFRNNERWLKETYFKLKNPYFIREEGRFMPQWLERYHGPHPGEIIKLQQDIRMGHLQEPLRPTEDIERLLNSPWYALGRRVLEVYSFIIGKALEFVISLIRMVLAWTG